MPSASTTEQRIFDCARGNGETKLVPFWVHLSFAQRYICYEENVDDFQGFFHKLWPAENLIPVEICGTSKLALQFVKWNVQEMRATFLKDATWRAI